MTEFGDFLKKQIENTGESISAVARGAGVERTTLHKAISGERTLSYIAMQKLMNYFHMSPHEKNVFTEYYNMQMQGRKFFNTRKMIVNLLKELSELPVGNQKHRPEFLAEYIESRKDDCTIWSGTYAVRNVMRRLIDCELKEKTPQIQIFLPAEDEFVMYYLYNIFSEYETGLEVTHIIPYLVYQGIDREEGMKILSRVLPLVLTASEQYRPYFYYSRSEILAVPFPFYMITGKSLLLISENFEKACEVPFRNFREHYGIHFTQALKKCVPMMTVQKDIFTVLKAYSQTVEKSSYYTFMNQPCMGKFYTNELIERKIKKEFPYREELVAESQRRFSELASVTKDYFTFFTASGLKEFMETGIVSDIPRQVIDLVTEEERYQLVESLKNEIAEDKIMGRVVNEERLSLPHYLSFSVNAQNKVDIFTLQQDQQDESIYSIHIDEPLIGASFLDFVHFLPKSEYVFSKEQTLEIIDKLLRNP